jgi:hypothetical protein|tara:strand:- start:1527 stop:1859 length:333 start_codon:yes stop_codon:yes gene_type:complete
MSNQNELDTVPELESVDDHLENIDEEEISSEEEIEDSGSFVEDSEIDEDDIDLDDLDDLDNPLSETNMLLSSVLSTEEGETVCSALVNISRQLEMQNKILIKMLSQLQKK